MGEFGDVTIQSAKNKNKDKTAEFLKAIEKAEKKALAENSDEEKSKKELLEFIENFFAQNGLKEYDKWSEKMFEIGRENPSLLVRREDPYSLLKLVNDKQSFQFKFKKEGLYEKSYPNAAMLGDDLSGLKIASVAGFGKIGEGAIVFIAGFLKGSEIKVSDLPNGKFLNYSGRERKNAKILEGKINPSDLKFILMRMPKKIFPKTMMTDKEENSEQTHISRLFVVEK